MNDQSWQLVEHVFNVAIDLPAAQRASYLDSACVDATVRAEVESLIAAEEKSKTFFESRIAAAARDAAAEREQTKKENRLGVYRIIRPLGAGTSGEVYLAERSDGSDRTRFAIKLLRAPSIQDLAQRAAKLRHDLASLSHPNIARLVDGGESPAGTPYLVMELVEGESLNSYCDRRALTIPERLELFCKVCLAVHYAHKHLVAHRNLKPAHVVVAADGTPKLLDLGVAQLFVRDEAPQPRTPIFASPEQIRGGPLGTASDVYALGVMLYELLSGRLPYDLRSSSAVEIERIVCDLATPAPSALARLEPPAAGSPDQQEKAETLSRKRGLSPEQLERSLRGDLDSIVLQAMHKDPERRYASAERLTEDLTRRIAQLPVRARGEAWSYRAATLLRRRWQWAATAAALMLLLIGLAGWSAVAGRRAAVERDAAIRAQEEANTVQRFLTDIFAAADPREERGGAVTAREILDWGAERIPREMPGQPVRQATLMSALSEAYSSLGLYPRAQELAEGALVKRTGALGASHPAVAASLNQIGRIERLRGRYELAEERYREALELDRAAEPPNHAAIAEHLDGLALALYDAADYAEAEATAREALEVRRQVSGEPDPSFGLSLANLGVILHRQGRHEEAEKELRAAVEALRTTKGELHPDTAAALDSLGALLRDAGRLQEAEESLGKALSATLEIYGERHPASADSLRSLAEVLRERGRANEAREMLQVALDVDRAALGAGHPKVAADLEAIGRLAREEGALEEAEAHFRAALENRLARGEPAGELLLELGSLLADGAKHAEAEPMLREALYILQKTAPASNERIAEAKVSLALSLSAQRRYPDAEQILTAGPAAEGTEPRQRRRALEALTQVYRDWGRDEDAARTAAALRAIKE